MVAAAAAAAGLRVRIRRQEEEGMFIYGSSIGLANTSFRRCYTKCFFCTAYILAFSWCVVGGLRQQAQASLLPTLWCLS